MDFRSAFEEKEYDQVVLQWVSTLGLDAELAQHLKVGTLFDGLRGLKEMSNEETELLINDVCIKFMKNLPDLLLKGLKKLRSSSYGSALSAVEFMNTKFNIDGAFSPHFGTLDDYEKGLEGRLGPPNPEIQAGMEIEHCRRSNSEIPFTTPNYNVTTTPLMEWEFVVCPKAGFEYPHTPKDKRLWKNKEWKGQRGRDVIELREFRDSAQSKRAGLKKVEVISLRLYTGSMFFIYNCSIRCGPASQFEKLQGNRYETTIFALASGISKLGKESDLPSRTILYRGMGGLILPREFWETYGECKVPFRVPVKEGDDVKQVVRELNSRVERYIAKNVYDVGLQVMNLPFEWFGQSMTHQMANQMKCLDGLANHIRVVESASLDGKEVVMVVALPISKSFFLERKVQFIDAVRGVLSSRREVTINEADVVNKPEDFRGAGVWLLLFNLRICAVVAGLRFKQYMSCH